MFTAKNAKKAIYNSVFALLTILFFAIGVFMCSRAVSAEKMASTFFVSFSPDRFTFGGFACGFLFKLLPLTVTVLSGFDFIGDFYSSAALALSALLSGYSTSALFCFDESVNLFVYSLYLVPEALTLLILLSSAVGQRAFRSYCFAKKVKPYKSDAFINYLRHGLFRTGLLFAFYIIRTAVCTVIV